MNTLIHIVGIAFPLVFTANIVMSAVKYLADGALSSTGKRVMLGVLAVGGTIASASLTGQPVDFNAVSSIALNTAIAAITAFGAHASYKAIKNA